MDNSALEGVGLGFVFIHNQHTCHSDFWTFIPLLHNISLWYIFPGSGIFFFPFKRHQIRKHAASLA